MASINPKRLLLLDRDGVINEDSDDYIKSPAEWLPIKGSLETIATLNKHNISVIVVTNQSGIGRGYFNEQTLSAIHKKMQRLLAELDGHVVDIFYCPHLPEDGCRCRKPASGLLEQIEKKYGISVASVPFIGDTEKDLLLAEKKSCLPVLVKTGKGSAYFQAHQASLENTLVFDNLEQAGDYLLMHHFKTCNKNG